MPIITRDHGIRIEIAGEWTLRVRAGSGYGVKADKFTGEIDAAICELFGSQEVDPLHMLTADDLSSYTPADLLSVAHRAAIDHMIAADVIVNTATAARRAEDLRALATFDRTCGVIKRPIKDGDETTDDFLKRVGSGACVFCDDETDGGGVWWDDNHKRYTRPVTSIIGLMCSECRELLYPAPDVEGIDRETVAESEEPLILHAINYATNVHRCETCAVAFPDARKLGGHRAGAAHKALAWIEYQRSIGNVILSDSIGDEPHQTPDGIAGVITRVLGLKPNEPTALGWWRLNPIKVDQKLDNWWKLDNLYGKIGSMIAVPPSTLALVEEAILPLIEMEIARKRENPDKWVTGRNGKHKRMRYDPKSDKAVRVRQTAFPLLVAIAAYHRGIKCADPFMRVAWGLGALDDSEGSDMSGKISHRIHEARREAFTLLGPSYFTIVHEIFGRAPGKLPTWARAAQ